MFHNNIITIQSIHFCVQSLNQYFSKYVSYFFHEKVESQFVIADSGDSTCSASDGSALPGHPGILLSINLDPDDKYFIFISIQYLRGIKWFEYFYD